MPSIAADPRERGIRYRSTPKCSGLTCEAGGARETLQAQRSEHCFDPCVLEENGALWLTWKESKVQRLQEGQLLAWGLDGHIDASSREAAWGEWAPWSHGQEVKRCRQLHVAARGIVFN